MFQCLFTLGLPQMHDEFEFFNTLDIDQVHSQRAFRCLCFFFVAAAIGSVVPTGHGIGEWVWCGTEFFTTKMLIFMAFFFICEQHRMCFGVPRIPALLFFFFCAKFDAKHDF